MRRSIFFIISTCLLLLGSGTAIAGPSPTDGASGSGDGSLKILQTALFAPGEVDLSTLGVSATELLTVGPQLDPLAGGGGGDMLIVDNDGLDCPNWEFPTIQLAVAAADPGDTIKVCRGVYIEQVTIPVGKDGLTLFAEAALQAVIQAPPIMTDPKAIVRVNGAHDVTIRHFTISGPGGGPCNSIRYGVFVDRGGSAVITDNHITEIHDTPFSGCQNGLGIAVGRTLGPDGPMTGSATVVHNLIDKYQKGGVLVDNIGSRAEVAYNEVAGSGPTSVIAQNGIQVSRGAEGDVHHNEVSRNFYVGADDATGVLLFSDPRVRVHHNDVSMNEAGIALFVDAGGTVEVSYNNSRSNVYGIVAYSGTSGNLIAYNKAFENTVLDCRDDEPTQNRWVKDLGRTENQPGLCKQAGPM
jgi:hypothetical protein